MSADFGYRPRTPPNKWPREPCRSFRLQTLPRFLGAKNCVDPDRAMQVLLDYFVRYTPEELVG